MSFLKTNQLNIAFTKKRSMKMFIFYLFSLALAVFAALMYGLASDAHVEQVRLEAQSKLDTESKRLDSESKERIAIETKKIDDASKEREEQIRANADKRIAEVQAEADQKIQAARNEANKAIAETNREAERLQAENLATKERLENERRTRLAMEESLAPRLLDEFELAGFLKKYKGQKVIFCVMPDAEALRTARMIGGALERSGWEILGSEPFPSNLVALGEGIMVQGSDGDGPDSPKTDEVGKTLVEKLNLYKLEARFVKPPKVPLTAGTIRLLVGVKPFRYFENKIIAERLRRERSVPIPKPDEELVYFTRAQRQAFKDKFKSVNMDSMPTLFLMCRTDSSEGCKYASEIAAVAREAGWKILDDAIRRHDQFPAKDSGITIIERWESHKEPSDLLTKAFEGIGIKLARAQDFLSSSEPILILVGKPK